MDFEKLGQKVLLWDRLTIWAMNKRFKTWDGAKNYCLLLGFGGLMGGMVFWSLVVSLCPFSSGIFRLGYFLLVGVPCVWLMWMPVFACMRLVPLTSIVPYGKPCRVSLDDKIWIRMLVWWRRSVKHLSEYDLVRSFSKHHSSQHPRVQVIERQYALKVIFNY